MSPSSSHPREISIGLVGAGRRARTHVRELFRLRDQEYLGQNPDDRLLDHPQPLYETYAGTRPDWVEDVSDLRPTVTAVFDPDEEARATTVALCLECGDGAGADDRDEPRAFDAYERFLEEGEYDAVVVSSPNHTHLDVVRPLLERGVDVLCEKPLATTLEDHDELVALASRSDGVFYVAFNMRSHPSYRRLADLLEADVIGELGMISCREVRMPFPDGHYYTQAESGGSLLEKNCHDFDLMNWLVDGDPTRVCAFGGQHVFTENTDVNDHAVVIVEYDSGVRASLDLCLYAPYGEQNPEYRGYRDYVFRGTEGILEGVPDGSNAWKLYTRRRRETFEATGFPGGHGGGDYVQLRNFLRCVRGEEAPPATPTDAKKAAAIAIGAERSIRDGTIVEIDSNYDLLFE
ncbi:Gfo/Idh/MocA family oxidoreductase [Natronoglomus mannanivorans]|uniref:Gfo/Idh/MocA family oxidoreductase n=1 Tax=Natronoglomus mannanivorans TaxID=2979990 RepID=A0AAP2Z158_9EURY|nr:Gfo/Idh/MocA family oxidoreductase [Halobacteria archaeon AArc-xg1-1]